jgi:hypothetical protein
MTESEASDAVSVGDLETDGVLVLVGFDVMLCDADSDVDGFTVTEWLTVGVGGGVTVGVVDLVSTADCECVGLGIHVAELDPSSVAETLLVSEIVVEKGGDLVGVQTTSSDSEKDALAVTLTPSVCDGTVSDTLAERDVDDDAVGNGFVGEAVIVALRVPDVDASMEIVREEVGCGKVTDADGDDVSRPCEMLAVRRLSVSSAVKECDLVPSV